jgi:hypothetical protein
MASNRAAEIAMVFEFEYCGECGGDLDDHILCDGPFGLPFVMCKAAPIMDGYVFRDGRMQLAG